MKILIFALKKEFFRFAIIWLSNDLGIELLIKKKKNVFDILLRDNNVRLNALPDVEHRDLTL